MDPGNANRYAYAADDPVNGFDPSGRSCGEAIFLTVLGGVGTVAAGAAVIAGSPSLLLGAAAAVGFSTVVAATVTGVGDIVNEC